MYANAIALVSAILMASTANAVIATNTMAQVSNISEEKFLNLAQTETETDSAGLNRAPYPYNFGYGDYAWWVKDFDSDPGVFVFLDQSEEQIDQPCE